MSTKHEEICLCECHREGTNIMHAFPCCNLCYDKYLTEDGEPIEAKLKPLLGEGRFERSKRQAEEAVERENIFRELERIFPDKHTYHYLGLSLEELRKTLEDAIEYQNKKA